VRSRTCEEGYGQQERIEIGKDQYQMAGKSSASGSGVAMNGPSTKESSVARYWQEMPIIGMD